MSDKSILASLKHLMDIEQQRLMEEQAARDRALAAQAEARAQAARRAREQEEQRLRIEEERRRAEEARRREEEAKLAAIRAAELERARIDAEARARIALLSKEQEHERLLASITHQKSGARRTVLASVALAASLLAAGLGLYHGKLKPDAERAELAHQAALREQEERTRKLEEEKARVDRKIAEAEKQLFEEKMKKATAMATVQPTPHPSTRPTGPSTAQPKKACKPCSDPGSPLCGLDGCEMNR